MQFLAVVRRRIEAFSAEEFERLLDPEAERVRALSTEVTIRAIYSGAEILGAVILLESIDEPAARAALASLPLARHDMLTFDLIPLRPYRGFAPRV